MVSDIKIRPMQASDIGQILAIQAACYTEIEPESCASLLAKHTASPATCFVAELGGGGQVAGYLLSVPCELANPPALNAPNCPLPAAPDCLYLHDLAIAPAGRGAGVGKMLMQAFMGALQASALHSASLIAIQGSAPYWMRFGFAPAPLTPPLAAKLQTYGQGAQYLRLVRMK